jgi:hypothetical protein
MGWDGMGLCLWFAFVCGLLVVSSPAAAAAAQAETMLE